jgi:hypothetical protein
MTIILLLLGITAAAQWNHRAFEISSKFKKWIVTNLFKIAHIRTKATAITLVPHIVKRGVASEVPKQRRSGAALGRDLENLV